MTLLSLVSQRQLELQHYPDECPAAEDLMRRESELDELKDDIDELRSELIENIPHCAVPKCESVPSQVLVINIGPTTDMHVRICFRHETMAKADMR